MKDRQVAASVRFCPCSISAVECFSLRRNANKTARKSHIFEVNLKDSFRIKRAKPMNLLWNRLDLVKILVNDPIDQDG